MPRGPSRRGLVPPFIAMDVLRAANAREAEGHSVIHLEVGQPGTPAPEAVLDAARMALARDRIGYTDALGLAPLREAIARHYAEQYGVAVEPAEVVVTTGSSAAFQLAFLAAFCRERDIRLVSDEIYHGITYETAAQTARAYGREAVVVNSFSKYYCMTGWRLGWMLVPPELARSVECLAQNFYVSPPALSQLAAPAAFGCRAELDAHVARYRTNRDLLIAMLKEVGLTRFAPAEGAFYLYVDVSDLTRDSQEFCRRMLDETGVAT